MIALRVMLRQCGAVDVAFLRNVKDALQAVRIEITQDAKVTTNPEVKAGNTVKSGFLALKLADHYEIAVLRQRAEAHGRRLWNLLRTGFADVLVWEDCKEPGAVVLARLQRQQELEALLAAPVVSGNLIGRSRAWRTALRQVIEAARYTDSPILLLGETGTGKELVTRLIHALDARPGKERLVTLDCTTVAPELAGSEFFGHERGAFTSAVAAREGAFALADRGTLFLDEVGELPPALQAELLRVVQEKTFKPIGSNTWRQTEFRLVCATHRDLKRHVEEGRFRADLYHRIAAWTCRLPPLRERREDILPLARYFTSQALPALRGEDLPGFDPAVEEFFTARDYPGNVRELRQLVTRVAKRHVGPGPLTAGDIPDDDRAEAGDAPLSEWSDEELELVLRHALASGAGFQEIKDRVAETVIRLAIDEAGGSLPRAASRLGVSGRALQLRRAARVPD